MDQSELLHYVATVFDRLEIPYFVTGSVASIAYGESRLTNDIDIVADLPASKLTAFLQAFPDQAFYISPEAAAQAVRTREQFNIIHPDSGLKIDLIVAKATEFDRSRLLRARPHLAGPGFEATFASPEDIIIKKMDFYREGGSEKHLRDITGILVSGRQPVDHDYISNWCSKLGLTDIWNAVLKRVRTK